MAETISSEGLSASDQGIQDLVKNLGNIEVTNELLSSVFLAMGQSVREWIRDYGYRLEADLPYDAVTTTVNSEFAGKFMDYCAISPFDRYLAETQGCQEKGLILIDNQFFESAYDTLRHGNLISLWLARKLKEAVLPRKLRGIFTASMVLLPEREMPVSNTSTSEEPSAILTVPGSINIHVTKLGLTERQLEMVQRIIDGEIIRGAANDVIEGWVGALRRFFPY